MPEPKHIIDIFRELVDNLRDTSSITNIVDNLNGTYTVTVSDIGDLANTNYVTIAGTTGFNDENWKVSSVTSVSFDITKATGTAIPVSFGTWTANAPYFAFEKWLGESKELNLKSLTQTYKLQKYPLIFVLLDISEQRWQTIANKSTANVFVYFITESNQKQTAEWRLLNSFKNVLIPLYNEFIDEVIDSLYINVDHKKKLSHSYKELFYLGTANANQNVLNEVVDAIEVNFNDLKFRDFDGQC